MYEGPGTARERGFRVFRPPISPLSEKSLKESASAPIGRGMTRSIMRPLLALLLMLGALGAGSAGRRPRPA